MTEFVELLYDIVTTEIQDNNPDKNVLSENISVATADTPRSFAASALVMENPEESSEKSDDELKEYLEARKNSWETEMVIEHEKLGEWVENTLAEFDNGVKFSEPTEATSEPKIKFVNDGADLTMTLEMDTDVSERLPELRTVLNEESRAIPSEDSVRTLTLDVWFECNENGESVPSHYDFTIHFATDNPHTYWANCETLEDYFEMIASDNDNTTVAEMRDKDEYYSHTHLANNKSGVVEWLEEFTDKQKEVAIDESDDDVYISTRNLDVDFETGEATIVFDVRKIMR